MIKKQSRLVAPLRSLLLFEEPPVISVEKCPTIQMNFMKTASNTHKHTLFGNWWQTSKIHQSINTLKSKTHCCMAHISNIQATKWTSLLQSTVKSLASVCKTTNQTSGWCKKQQKFLLSLFAIQQNSCCIHLCKMWNQNLIQSLKKSATYKAMRFYTQNFIEEKNNYNF